MNAHERFPSLPNIIFVHVYHWSGIPDVALARCPSARVRCFQEIMLTVDRRELDLIRALADVPHEVRELPVGDVVCEYGEIDGAWVGERKRASDLVASLTGGRLFEQTARLHGAGYSRIFWFVEGDLRGHPVSHECLLGRA